jgi:site-specific DNA-cytosine methylase
MRILDLCSGTQSISRWAAADAEAHTVVTVDIRPRVRGQRPTHCVDVTAWDYRAVLTPGEFDMVWASPPCIHYSKLRTYPGIPPRDLEGADRIVARCLEIIEYLAPRAWVMENPATGLLRTREVVAGLPFVDAHYCRYGGYLRKPTRFWTNLSDRLQLLKCEGACGFMEGGRHVYAYGNRHGYLRVPGESTWRICEVPAKLLEVIMAAAHLVSSSGTRQ